MLSNLKLKAIYLEQAQSTITKVIAAHSEKLKAKQHKKKSTNSEKGKSTSKKKKTKKDFTLVGIHVRRGDHIAFEAERGIPHLRASYFLEAMEKFR